MKKIIATLLVLLLVQNASAVKPGDWLYPFDRAIERIELIIARTDNDRAIIALSHARERLEEMELIENNNTIEKLQRDAEASIVSANNFGKRIRELSQQRMVEEKITLIRRHHVTVLERVVVKLREVGIEPKGLSRAIEIGRRRIPTTTSILITTTITADCNYNGVCDVNENQVDCPEDCEIPETPTTTTTVPITTTMVINCDYDGICGINENQVDCPDDCKPTDTITTVPTTTISSNNIVITFMGEGPGADSFKLRYKVKCYEAGDAVGAYVHTMPINTPDVSGWWFNAMDKPVVHGIIGGECRVAETNPRYVKIECTADCDVVGDWGGEISLRYAN